MGDFEKDGKSFKDILEALNSGPLNEADTRHKIIDVIIHDFLAWPRNRVKLEQHVTPGFMDYVLRNSNDDPIIVIEAKREGHAFDLPVEKKRDELFLYEKISNLISDKNIKEAMSQVKAYCFDIGCEYACISNGREWIFFKTFEKGKKWEDLKALVLRSVTYFYEEHTKAINNFSYTAITEKFSLVKLLTSIAPTDRYIYFPKEKISSYEHPINSNKLAPTLRPAVTRYFGTISDTDAEFMDRCYVSERNYHQTIEGMRGIIQDTLSPYFSQYNIQQLDDTGKGGQLGGRLKKIFKRVERVRC